MTRAKYNIMKKMTISKLDLDHFTCGLNRQFASLVLWRFKINILKLKYENNNESIQAI